jgi:beta-phosphoglucomutase-like phosphatase (HAD superfamily)
MCAVIFDLDGVLADSEPWWNQIDAKLLAEYGVTYRGEYHQNVVGVSYRLAVEFYKKAFGLSVPTEEMMQRRGEIARISLPIGSACFRRSKKCCKNCGR